MELANLQSGRGKQLADAANRIAELFPVDFEEILDSTVLVVSKVQPNVALKAIITTLQKIAK